MPGIFCEAIVTTNSGTPRPIIVAGTKLGITNATCGTKASFSVANAPSGNSMPKATTNTKANSAAGTAHSRRQAPTKIHVARITPPISGNAAMALNGAKHSPTKIPANIALANGPGIRETAFASGFHSPAMMMSTPQSKNAPTAAANPPSTAPVVTNKAEPGVDQATLTGRRGPRLRMIPHKPIVIVSAISPDAAWVGVAPTATKPCKTTAKDDAKPTNAASNPIIIA